MLDFEECWAALERRDAGAAHGFLYGVRTTGVYCRPGCTSRLPLRANTMFFETMEAAQAAGLEALQALPPDRSLSVAPHRGDRESVRAAADERDHAEPGRARRRGGHQPVSFSPGVQADHRRDARAIMREPTGSAASPRSSRQGSR